MALCTVTHRQLKKTLVEAIAGLCQKGLQHKSAIHIQGLLGVTVDRSQVVLIDINDVVHKNNDLSNEKTCIQSCVDIMTQSKLQSNDSYYKKEDNHWCNDDEPNDQPESQIHKRPLVPMHSFKSPFKRQRVLRHKPSLALDEKVAMKPDLLLKGSDRMDKMKKGQSEGSVSRGTLSNEPETPTPAYINKGCSVELPVSEPVEDEVGFDLRNNCQQKSPLKPLFSPNLVKEETEVKCVINGNGCHSDGEDAGQVEQDEALNLVKPKKVRFDVHNPDECAITKCHLCGQVMSSARNLEHHLQRHKGVYPYTCPYCSRGFSSSTNLKGHLWKHTNIKDFSCHICSAEFIYKINLKRHMRKKHPESITSQSAVGSKQSLR